MKRLDNILVLAEDELRQLASHNIPVNNQYFLIGIDKPTRDVVLTPCSMKNELVVHISEAPKHVAKLQLTLEAPVQAKIRTVHSVANLAIEAELNITGLFNPGLRMPTTYKLREVYTDHVFMNGRLVAPHIIFSPVTEDEDDAYTRKD